MAITVRGATRHLGADYTATWDAGVFSGDSRAVGAAYAMLAFHINMDIPLGEGYALAPDVTDPRVAVEILSRIFAKEAEWTGEIPEPSELPEGAVP